MGAELIRWTIWTALAFYFAACWAELIGRGRPSWRRLARAFWTIGCAAFVVHVLCAFQFAYGWSHDTALASTAKRTEEVVGRAVGQGVWVSYFFTLLWVVDAAMWWTPRWIVYRENRWYRRSVDAFMAFIIVNGTMVFESGAVRWFAGLGFVFLIITWQLAHRQSSIPATAPASDRT